MARGGARNRSGPAPDPTSARSEKRSYKLTALPREGYTAAPPEFPLIPAVVINEWFDKEQGKIREVDHGATDVRRDREATLWGWAWSTPQACAWSMEPWRWQAVAMWVRTSALCESPEATAADKNSLHRFADQIGLTPAGMKENGWAITPDQVSEKREEKAVPVPSGPAAPRVRRLRVAGGSGA